MTHADVPHILLVTTDQQRADTVGAPGGGPLATPHLDRLAREGLVLERAYCANPLCSPSRASLLTGLYPSGHGCWNVGVALPPETETIAHLLSRRGYLTALIGKGHLQPCLAPGSPEAPPRVFAWDHWRTWHGPYYGFSHCELAIGHTREAHAAGMHYGLWLREHGVDVPAHFGGARSHEVAADEDPHGARGDAGPWSLPDTWHNSRWVAERGIAYLQAQAAAAQPRPFFLWLSFQDPHPPFVVPAPWYDRASAERLAPPAGHPADLDGKPSVYQVAYTGADGAALWGAGLPPAGFALNLDHARLTPARTEAWRRAYAGMLSLLDQHLGRVLQALDDTGLARKTLVLFTSDHGELLGDFGLWGKGPFHTEGLVRVPLLVRWPEYVPPGTRSRELVSLVDVAPTLAEAAGARVPPGLDGRSQLRLLRGRATGGGATRRAVRVENRATERLDVVTVVTARHKLTWHRPGDEGELYDLEEDPAERVNRWAAPAYAEIRRALLSEAAAVPAVPGDRLRTRAAYA